jgi:hypothetical protein
MITNYELGSYGHYSSIFPQVLRDTTKNFNVVGLRAEIWTRSIPDTYHYTATTGGAQYCLWDKMSSMSPKKHLDLKCTEKLL